LFAARQDAIRLIVLYMGSVPRLDLAGAELVAELHRTYAARGADVRLADTHGEVRDALHRIAFSQPDGREFGQTVDAVVAEWLPHTGI
jgi:MFS superfamily sulfate permease-like transporter